jgi:hypothetical protein
MVICVGVALTATPRLLHAARGAPSVKRIRWARRRLLNASDHPKEARHSRRSTQRKRIHGSGQLAAGTDPVAPVQVTQLATARLREILRPDHRGRAEVRSEVLPCFFRHEMSAVPPAKCHGLIPVDTVDRKVVVHPILRTPCAVRECRGASNNGGSACHADHAASTCRRRCPSVSPIASPQRSERASARSWMIRSADGCFQRAPARFIRQR